MIVKTLINLIEIVIITKILYKAGCFLLKRKSYNKNKKGKSIFGKVIYLISNNIHYNLDQMIKAQKAKRLADGNQQTKSNVVEIKKYQRI